MCSNWYTSLNISTQCERLSLKGETCKMKLPVDKISEVTSIFKENLHKTEFIALQSVEMD